MTPCSEKSDKDLIISFDRTIFTTKSVTNNNIEDITDVSFTKPPINSPPIAFIPPLSPVLTPPPIDKVPTCTIGFKLKFNS